MIKRIIGFFLLGVLLSTNVFAQLPSASAQANAEAQRMISARYGASPMPMTGLPSKEKIQSIIQRIIQIAIAIRMVQQPTMVTVDNGVIVAYGGLLMKYDKDLNLVKQVHLSMDADSLDDLSSDLAKKYSKDLTDVMDNAMKPDTTGASSPASEKNVASQ